MKRVKSLLQRYDALCIGLNLTFGEAIVVVDQMNVKDDFIPITELLRNSVAEQEEIIRRANKLSKIEDEERLEIEKKKQTKEENERKLAQKEQEAISAKERDELALRAETARINRLEAMRRAEEDRLEAEREFLASVEISPDGIRRQLERIRSSCCSSEEINMAMGALHTLFYQISCHPEEIKFRRIRRDHEKFVADIGRHDGGEQVLLAAGFTLTEIDGNQCFFSREPDLESDMDSWSKVSNTVFSQNTMDILLYTDNIIKSGLIISKQHS